MSCWEGHVLLLWVCYHLSIGTMISCSMPEAEVFIWSWRFRYMDGGTVSKDCPFEKATFGILMRALVSLSWLESISLSGSWFFELSASSELMKEYSSKVWLSTTLSKWGFKARMELIIDGIVGLYSTIARGLHSNGLPGILLQIWIFFINSSVARLLVSRELKVLS